jgi:helicase-like protein/SNF2 domain-containing protein
MRIASSDDVRATIAAHLLGTAVESGCLGNVVLHPHQRDGVDRVERLLAEHGGALLADDVGLGKTYVALAIARRWQRPLVVAPAALAEVWTSAAYRAGVAVRFASVESLSRRHLPDAQNDLVVIDEAHHLRSAHTRRFAAAGALCRGAKVLLMTATPIQNRVADLRTILSLFLGERAPALPSEDLARFIVRRSDKDLSGASFGLPAIRPPEWLRSVDDVDCLDRILALPPPLPPLDGGAGGVLLTYTLVRQWASSRAALRSALQRRLARARAMEDALLAGRMPSRAELTAWCHVDGVQQLTFPELAVQSQVADAAALLVQIGRHADGVRELLAWLGRSADPDRARANALLQVMLDHPGERVVAFSEYADTVSALYRAIAPSVRAAMLTHGGGRVAGGPLSRRELLMRLSPGRASSVAASDGVDVLLTTDVLSEGVNLQEASVVVHLDLSWNPARLEQRVGRLRRIGAARGVVSVYAFAPPAPAERMLQLDRRLRLKLSLAARTMGVAGAILPGFESSVMSEASGPREERIAALVRAWRREGVEATRNSISAAVRSARDAAIACVRCDEVVSLVALIGDRVTEARADIEALLGVAQGEDVSVPSEEIDRLHDRLATWLRERSVSDVVDLPALRVAHSRRSLLHRVDAIARRASRHTQPQLAPLMRAARTAATATLSAGAERVLDELARAPMPDAAWLHAVGEFAALHARHGKGAPAEILALLVLRSG